MSEVMTKEARELSFDARLLERRPEDGWELRNGSWWIASETLDPRALTAFMLANRARLMTVTALPVDGGEVRLNYHWDLKGVILTFSTQTRENSFPSIADLCPAADWIERETYEYFAVTFTGRDNSKPLMLRPGLEAGLNRKKGEKL